MKQSSFYGNGILERSFYSSFSVDLASCKNQEKLLTINTKKSINTGPDVFRVKFKEYSTNTIFIFNLNIFLIHTRFLSV